MSLKKQIENNYSKRINKDNLYNSYYSSAADIERHLKIKKIVKEFLTVNNESTILEIGAGQGGNIPLLREVGFNDSKIFTNELLEERILLIEKNYPQIKIYRGDALEINFNQTFDCIFQSTVFTSILENKDRVNLANKMWDMLKPGGMILWYDFIYNNPFNPDVKKVTIYEAKKLFSKSRNTKIIKLTLAPPIGRRVGRLYNLLNFPFLRSHILGVFQK